MQEKHAILLIIRFTKCNQELKMYMNFPNNAKAKTTVKNCFQVSAISR
jgi:hypothetical protein